MKEINLLKRIFDRKHCHNKKHYGANIISFDPPLAVCTKCGKKVIPKN